LATTSKLLFFVKTGKWIIPVQVLYIYAVCACFDVQKPRDALPEQEIVGMDWHKAEVMYFYYI